jgi:uncharacterized Zn-finger protein
MRAHKLEAHDEVMTSVVPFEKPKLPKRNFICFCKKSFFTNKLLGAHQADCEIHINSKQEDDDEESTEIEWKCPICNRNFACRSNLLRHQKSKLHYSEEKLEMLKFSCENCQKKFFSESSLKRHMKYKPECDPSYA